MLAGKALELLVPTDAVRIDPVHCARRRFSRTSCRRCAEACPSGAIHIERDPRIDPELCTGCRRCEAACPTGAVRGDERDLGALSLALAETAKPVLGCRSAGAESHVRTGCLGFLESEGLLALSLFFADGLTLNLTRCGKCRNGAIVRDLQSALETLQHAGISSADRIRFAFTPEELAYREPSLSRRDFFTFMRKRSSATVTTAAARLTSAPEKPDGSRKRLTPRRRLLLRGLSDLPVEERRRIEEFLFSPLAFGPGCTRCTGCTGICPSGALSTTPDDPPRPEYDPQRCLDCGLCLEFCRRKGRVSDRHTSL